MLANRDEFIKIQTMNQALLQRLFLATLAAMLASCSNIGKGSAEQAFIDPSGQASTNTGSSGSGSMIDPFPSSSRTEAISRIETFLKQYYATRTREALIVTRRNDSFLLADVNALRNELRPTANEWEQLTLDFQLFVGFLSDQPQIALRVTGGYTGGMGSRAPDPDSGYIPFDRSQSYRLDAYAGKLLSEFQGWMRNNNPWQNDH
ncbi:MAG: hypothetical protein K9N47_27995 [Prosthecobacter sp.]|uniref:hypothetical protein n=1 Tax=Prosthecobacter sp. TaxID=1965333 RepID=UPI0026371E64|nr:hypothetical protein [Prosthecobacter sp.]MCF7789994.1 hypothetical protein [Prosthecobacter sp.]